MSSSEQFSGVVSSSEAGGVFGRENVVMKHLTQVNLNYRSQSGGHAWR